MSEPQTVVGNISPFIPSLLGAFCGALGAFSVGLLKEWRDEKNRRHTALLATQYALYSQWSVLEDIRVTFLDLFRKDPIRWQHQKYFIRTVGELRVPFDDLTFIITSEEPNLLQEIHLAEKRFLSSIHLLEMLNEVRQELQRKYPPEEFNMETGTAKQKVPVHESYALKNLTELLYDEVDKAVPDLERTKNKLSDFVHSATKFSFPDFMETTFGDKKAPKYLPIEQSTPKQKGETRC